MTSSVTTWNLSIIGRQTEISKKFKLDPLSLTVPFTWNNKHFHFRPPLNNSVISFQVHQDPREPTEPGDQEDHVVQKGQEDLVELKEMLDQKDHVDQRVAVDREAQEDTKEQKGTQ